MNTICLIVVLCFLSFSDLVGRIRNGYEPKLESAKVSLQKLNLLLSQSEGLSIGHRLRIKSEMDDLIDYISYYKLTEELLQQFRIISPRLYAEMDNIKDRQGRLTDVYVKLINRKKSRVQLEAATFFYQAPMDEDANLSQYGMYSVSIEIWIGDNSLFLLSHELGHTKYIVPNLATYTEFYVKQYGTTNVNISYIGHRRYDLGGKWANAFEKEYREEKAIFLQKNGGKKPQSLASLFYRIRRNTFLEATHPPSAIVSNYDF